MSKDTSYRGKRDLLCADFWELASVVRHNVTEPDSGNNSCDKVEWSRILHFDIVADVKFVHEQANVFLRVWQNFAQPENAGTRVYTQRDATKHLQWEKDKDKELREWSIKKKR